MRRFSITLAFAGSLLLYACHDDDANITKDLNIDRTGFIARFDLTATKPEIPFPNNLLFNGTDDGTLNIPFDPTNPASAPTIALNALDGFSTIAPIRTTFSSAIDASSINSSTVKVFEVTLSSLAGGVTSIERELGFGAEFIATTSSLDVDSSQSTLAVTLLKPLTAKSHYLIMLSNGIKNINGKSAASSVQYLIAKRITPLFDDAGKSQIKTLTDKQAADLEPVRQLINAQEAALAGQSIDTSTIVLSWTFSTQSIGEVLTTVRTTTGNSVIPSVINPTSIGTTAKLLSAGPGLADIYVGTLDVPYYLTNADASPTDPRTTFWQGAEESNLTQRNPTPIVTSTETIPLILSIPNGANKAAPWPVVIYQHGINSERSTILAIADVLANIGFATIAIDLPLHGVAPGTPFYSENERTFDLDLVNNTTRASFAAGETPDGADPSGQHFINFTSLRTSRDNVRQGVADLFALTQALQNMDYDGGEADFDTDRIHFLGQSLGGIVGATFLALEPQIKSAVLAVTGGGIPKLLDGSARFGPVIQAGLAANGVIKGTADYEGFLGAAQTVIDAGDPINYATKITSNRGVLLLEVIGDSVIPNNVLADAPEGTTPAPLSGTDPLAKVMGFTKISATASGENLTAWIRFTAGHHGSALTPNDINGEADATSAQVNSVMQEAIASFFASNGATVTINNESVVE